MKFLLQLVLAVIVASSAIAENSAQEKDRVKAEMEAEAAANLKREAVLAELKRLGAHDWAGDYYAGDGTGMNVSLTLAPDSGYVFEWRSCLDVFVRDSGPAIWKDGHVHLSFTESSRKLLPAVDFIAPELISIPWGVRRYIIPAGGIVGFCNEINQGMEPRSNMLQGSYLLRIGDEKKKADGLPILPIEFKRYLLSKPVEAKIIAVGVSAPRPSIGGLKFKATPLTLDAGTNRGLLAGMELFVTESGGPTEPVRITEVEPGRAEATMIQNEKEQVPKVGSPISTRAWWHSKKAD
jgi:hypothetical protein